MNFKKVYGIVWNINGEYCRKKVEIKIAINTGIDRFLRGKVV